MKKLLMVFSLLAVMHTARAQSANEVSFVYKSGSGMNDVIKPNPKSANDFCNVAVDVQKGKITFLHLPVEKRACRAVITNMQGDIIKQMRVAPGKNVMDVHRLHHGLYFATIMYKDKARKAFVLHLS
jgi:hypothetical protein